jgi:urea transport system substrate-binding protein
VVDGKSDWPTFAREAERLISEENVSVIFGCWTSACRKTVKPVFEQLNHLLFYPVQYEGLEASSNIIYTGAAPNQQIIPAVAWSFENLGQRFFLVGSDYVFPRTANAIIRDQVIASGGEIAGEEYLLLGSSEVEGIVQAIVKTQPDVILNTINGDSNIAFFSVLRAAGITPETIPTVSFSIAEPELQSLDMASIVGDYTAWNYFQSVDREENLDFVRRFKAAYGESRVVSDPLEAAYFGVYLWSQAVQDAGTTDVNQVRVAVANQSLNAPEGTVYIDPLTNHTWKTVRIGQIQEEGQFSIVWSSEDPIRPLPYPASRSQSEWEAFLEDLYTGWGNQWANPGG